MEKSQQKPAPLKAFEILGGMFNTLVSSSLFKANVFETIGHGSKSIDEIAAACNLNKNVLFRALRYMAFADVVRIEDGKYALTEVGKYFLKDTPGSLSGSMSFVTAPPWRDSWFNFSHCLKTGEPAFDHVFGMPFFDFLDKNQEYGKPFNHYQTMMTQMVAELVANTYDFGAYKTICDVGGGQGILLKSVLKKYSGCRGILYDMESALKDNVLEEVANRCEIVSGNFFETVPNADCMLLKTIIHDWNDEKSIEILTNCRKSLNPGGKIILVEQVVEEPYSLMALFYDLHMQVMLGGAERTRDEFISLFEAAGLKLERIIPMPSPMKLLEIACI